MYEAYFHLRKRPFAATPDAGCFFATEDVQNVLDELLLRAASGQGIGILTAPAGMGKTLLCRRLALELSEQFTAIFLGNASFSTRRALLQAVHFELGRQYTGMDEQELRLELIASLKELVNSGRGAILIVDEAHLLNDRLLEELRALSTLSEGDQPLVHVILAGQMTLEEKLAEPALEGLNQRIICHTWLEPFTRAESIAFIDYRLQAAGSSLDELFDRDSREAIARACDGVPRCLIQLCDHCLLLACVHERPIVTEELVREALSDLKQLPLQWNDLPPATATVASGELDDLGADYEIDDELLDAPEVDETIERGWCEEPRPASESAAFEVGDEELIADDELVYETPAEESVPRTELTWHILEPKLPSVTGEGVVPLPGTSPSDVRVYREESVDDRYAALDRGGPRAQRTFEDAALPAGWQFAGRPVSEIPSVPGAASPPEEVRTPAPTESGQTIPLPVAEVPAVELGGEDDVEESIGNTVLDVCLDVQTSLSRWWNPDAFESESVAPPAEAEQAEDRVDARHNYDVVEPEASNRGATGVSSGESLRADIPAERHIPRPNYRNVFSALRRKLGRSLHRR